MPDPAWSAQHERQYLHLRDSLLERGLPESLAEEIAAKAVHRALAGQAEPAAAHARPIDDGSTDRHGGQRAHPGPNGKTLLQLREEARHRGLPGRSAMNKSQLELALSR